jgi:hypothetical protein
MTAERKHHQSHKRMASLVGGPLDGETRTIPRVRKFVVERGEIRHVYRPSGQKGVWSYDLESSTIATMREIARRQVQRRRELDSEHRQS